MKKKSLLICILMGALNYMVAQDVVVANIGLNIVYQHVDNPIAISVASVNSDIVWVSAENARITKIGGVKYSILVTENIKNVELKIYKIVKQDTIFVSSNQFKVLPITPYLKPVLFGKKFENDLVVEIPKAMIKQNNALFIKFDESFFFGVERKFKIKKFDIIYGNEKQSLITSTITGNIIPNNIIESILKENDSEIKILNIEVEGIGVLTGIYTIKLK